VREDRIVQSITRQVALLIAENRARKKISKEELSRRSGISPAGIRLIEQQKREASLYVLLLLCRAMGLNLSRLLEKASRQAGAINRTSRRLKPRRR
jgi:transcriptional regulator with XRE-family HTH domain